MVQLSSVTAHVFHLFTFHPFRAPLHGSTARVLVGDRAALTRAFCVPAVTGAALAADRDGPPLIGTDLMGAPTLTGTGLMGAPTLTGAGPTTVFGAPAVTGDALTGDLGAPALTGTLGAPALTLTGAVGGAPITFSQPHAKRISSLCKRGQDAFGIRSDTSAAVRRVEHDDSGIPTNVGNGTIASDFVMVDTPPSLQM
jgi:hypothetical protein